mgnify:CR=1 FL=1
MKNNKIPKRDIINEKFDEKLKELYNKIKEAEIEEGRDDFSIEIDYDPKSFKKANIKDLLKNIDRDSLTPEEDFIYDIDLEDELYDEDEYGDPFIEGGDEPLMEGEMCEQCGSGNISEGECNECGYKRMNEGLYDVDDIDDENEFDYVEEVEDLPTDEEILDRHCNSDNPEDIKICQDRKKMLGEEINEKLYGKQKMLDKNKNNKIDAEDFKLLRKNKKEVTEKWKGDVEVEKTGEYADMTIEEIDDAIKKLKKQNERFQEQGKKVPQKNREKMSELYFAKRSKQGWKGKGKAKVGEEVEEGNKFTGMLAKSRKGDKFTIDGKTYTDTSNYDLKENVEYHIRDVKGDIIKLTESELVDLIENIVNEQKTPGLKTIGKPKGLTTYEKAHKGSGKENEEYLKSVNKKMKDYLKDGSKGTYDMNPKMFPQGNGELGKMDKKAFKMTDELEDFNYEIAGQNFPVPDAIDYNEEWMEKLFKGDSMTGNAPGGNALESETNDRFNKMRKKNTLKKLKDQSYKRVPQPVYNEKTGSDVGKGLNIKLESTESKTNEILNEEFGRIKELLNYNRKTQ